MTVSTGSLQEPSTFVASGEDAGGIQKEAAVRNPPTAVVEIKEYLSPGEPTVACGEPVGAEARVAATYWA
jgi:hypothetical protein